MATRKLGITCIYTSRSKMCEKTKGLSISAKFIIKTLRLAIHIASQLFSNFYIQMALALMSNCLSFPLTLRLIISFAPPTNSFPINIAGTIG